jgi:hypothetical protein
LLKKKENKMDIRGGNLELLASEWQKKTDNIVYVYDGREFFVVSPSELCSSTTPKSISEPVKKKRVLEATIKNSLGNTEYHIRDTATDQAYTCFTEFARDLLLGKEMMKLQQTEQLKIAQITKPL